MSHTSQSNEHHLGFLTVVELTTAGYCGGLLVVSVKGRPVEFHCTAPVVPNRAQEILYGRTLRPFLVVDQIGVALTERVKSPLAALVIDTPELADLQSIVTMPLALLKPSADETRRGHDSASPSIPEGDAHLEINDHWLELYFDRTELQQLAENQLRRFAELLPITEPFERIRNAISEAHKVAA